MCQSNPFRPLLPQEKKLVARHHTIPNTNLNELNTLKLSCAVFHRIPRLQLRFPVLLPYGAFLALPYRETLKMVVSR